MNENGERQKKEEEYWGQHHSAQPYATKDHPFQPYAAAYRAGVNAFSAYPDQDFEDFIDEVALNYERENPGSPLPWDHARHAVHAAWAKLSNEITPLDPIVESAPVFDPRAPVAPGARTYFRGYNENDRAGD